MNDADVQTVMGEVHCYCFKRHWYIFVCFIQVTEKNNSTVTFNGGKRVDLFRLEQDVG